MGKRKKSRVFDILLQEFSRSDLELSMASQPFQKGQEIPHT